MTVSWRSWWPLPFLARRRRRAVIWDRRADRFVAELRGDVPVAVNEKGETLLLRPRDLPSAQARFPVAATTDRPPWEHGTRADEPAIVPPASDPSPGELARLRERLDEALKGQPDRGPAGLGSLVSDEPLKGEQVTGPPTIVGRVERAVDDDLGGYLEGLPAYPED